MMENVLRQASKFSISNYLSHFTYDDACVGLGKTFYICKRVQSEKAKLATLVLKKNGQEIIPVLSSNTWFPWGIFSEYQAGELKIIQKIVAAKDILCCDLEFRGEAGFTAEVCGESYHAAKAFAAADGIIIEETSTLMKPLVTRVALDCGFQECMVSEKTGVNIRPLGSFCYSEAGLAYRFKFDLLPRQLKIRVVFSQTEASLRDLAREQHLNSDYANEIREDWEDFFTRNVPKLTCSDEAIEKVYYYNWYVQRVNTIRLGGDLPYPFTSPSKVVITGYWLWDCSLHALTQAWLNEYDVFYGNLLNATNVQSDAGCMPDAAREYGMVAGDGQWYSNHVYDAKERTGDPKLFPVAVWDIYMKTGDVLFLQRMYPHLLSEYRWLAEDKASTLNENLIVAKTWCDISWDNSKRFGKNAFGGYGGAAEDQRKDAGWGFPIATIDGNMHFCMLLHVISETAKLLGDDQTFLEFRDRAAKTKQAIQTVFWDEQEGYFFDKTEDGSFIRVHTPAALVLLYAGIPTMKQYKRMKAIMLDPQKLWVKYPLATVGLEDDSFDPENYWRGPAWVVVNYEVTDGLFDYDPESAFKLFFKTIDLVMNTGDPTSREHYNSLTGAGGGALDYAWDGIINKLIINRILGVNPHPGKVRLMPFLPKELDHISIENVEVSGTRMNLAYHKGQGCWTATIENNGANALALEYGNRDFTIEPGQTLRLELPAECPGSIIHRMEAPTCPS